MGKKALVVDDDPNNLMLEKDLLEVAGFEVFEAVDASSGIAIAKKEKPDIIIMDVRLPDMLGPEAAKILHKYKETSHIPIVFVSAYVKTKDRKQLDAIANTIFISKPLNTRTFAQEILKFLR